MFECVIFFCWKDFAQVITIILITKLINDVQIRSKRINVVQYKNDQIIMNI